MMELSDHVISVQRQKIAITYVQAIYRFFKVKVKVSNALTCVQ